MAIIAVSDIFYRKFSGYEDPRYPTGFWLGDGVIVGDATGGTMISQINFNPSTNLFNSQYYSLEEIMVDLDELTTDILGILIANFDTTATITARQYTVGILANENVRSNINLVEGLGLLPLFLGQQTTPNTALSISLIRTNADGDILKVRIGGYVWSVRSTSIPGGPQRPPTGLYRQ